MRLSASAQRARLLHLFVCFSLLAQSLLPVPALAAGRGTGKAAPPPAGKASARQDAEAADLPDLEEARNRPHREPKAVPPVPSTRRRCPPRNPRCNDDPGGAPQPAPTPGRVPKDEPGGAALAPAPAPPTPPADARALASVTAPPLWPLPAAGAGGGLPPFDFSLLDFYRLDGGYGHSDASAAGPLAGLRGAYGGAFRPAAFVQGGGSNLAQGKVATQSSTLIHTPPGDAWRAVDGNTDGDYFNNSVTSTNSDSRAWWQVDLGAALAIGNIDLWNRTDCCAERLSNYYVFVSDDPFASTDPAQTQAQAGVWTAYTAGQAPTHSTLAVNRTGRYVRVQLAGTGYLSLAEVQVFARAVQPVPPQGIPPAESVAWTNAVGVSPSGNSLTKTAGTMNWDAGAMSTKAIASGNGYVEFTASETNTYRMLGLSHGDSNQSYTDIDFAIYPADGGILLVYEAGAYRGTFGIYAAGDRLRVSVAGGVVSYSKNGQTLYTSAAAPRYPLLADTSLHHPGATITNAVISGALVENVVWANVVPAGAASGNNLVKVGGANAWNAGASSTRVIAGGDGYAEFTASETNTYRMFGLSRGDSHQSFDDIDFALYAYYDGTLHAYEAGVYKAYLGPYAAGDRLRVSVEGGQVRYRRNGALLYTSAAAPQYPLLVDTSLYNAGATVHNAVVSAPLPSQTDPGGTGLTARYYDNLDFTGYKLTRLDYTVNFWWDQAAPAPGVGADEFSVRWTGMIVPRYSQTYTFYANTDDGVRLWVDGRLIIDNWQDKAASESAGQITLEAGRAYTIRMEFYDRFGGAVAQLSWWSQSQAKEIVPQSRLLPCWKGVEQFVTDFYQAALRRRPSSHELQDWTERLAQAQGEGRLVAAAQALGHTILNSAEYAALNPTDNQRFVSDLYWGYLQRAPDADGLSWWTGEVNSYGRAHGITAFEGSIEFQEKVLRLCGTAAASGTNGGDGYNFAAARLDPSNRTGGGGADSYSRNYNFSIPLVSLAGRGGLDLGLVLSYNSLVWTKDGSGVTFDADRGTPSPGFRLGFPTLQPKFYNPQTQKNAYLLVTPAGGRVELRQVGATNVYESADSSYLQLTEGDMTLRSADGTQLSFTAAGGEWRCWQVKDRNGNYISVAYYGDGRVWKVTDTLGRALTFNYDNYQNLLSITQPWRRETEANPSPAQDEAHQWATFGYTNVTLQPSFSNLAVIGEQPGTVIPALSQVGLDDGSYYKFSYNQWGQVWKVTHYAADSVGATGQPTDAHPLSSTRLNLPGSDLQGPAAQADCPRFTQERTWVENGVMNQSGEVTTKYDAWAPNMASCEVTLPDNTTKRVSNYHTPGDGWKKGLTASEVITSGGTTVRTTALSWEHDGGATTSYPTNPRVTQTSVTDPQTQPLPLTRTTKVTYTIPSDFQGESGYAGTLNVSLPKKVEVCAGSNCSTPLRTTVTDYKVANLSEYVARRILGLARRQSLYDGADSAGNLRSQVEYRYDEPDDPQNNDTFLVALPPASPAASQHDGTNYGQSMTWRGNANRVRRYSVNQTNGAVGGYVESRAAYNVTGTLAYTKNALGHQTSVSYMDSFFLNINRTAPLPQNQLKTFAYPTTVTDPDGFTSSVWYNYDMGLAYKSETPLPDVTNDQSGPEVSRLYDAARRVVRVTNSVNAARMTVVYPASMTVVQTYTLIDAGLENYSASVLDGAGRVRASAVTLPYSAGGYAGQITDYDSMGRVSRMSNPTETSAAGSPWAATGEDAPANGGFGWVYTQTSYDWRGRPKLITNPDNTTKEFLYGGCGCAGGETVTTRDESGRRQRVTYDALGRVRKTQVLTQQASKPQPFTADPNEAAYSTVTNTYDALDNLREVRERAEASAVEQVTTMAYDGFGRLQSRHTPEQNAGAFMTFTYNADDTPATVTDGRGAVTTYSYNGYDGLSNNRRLLTGITFSGSTSPDVSFKYDAAGNRKRMDDGQGWATYSYDALSRVSAETRYFNNLGASYTLSYGYNLAGQLKTLTDAAGYQFTYTRDAAGRLTDVTGAPFGNVASYVTGARYRAWGAFKAANTYDIRMRPSAYANLTYAYEPDGRLAQVTDLSDGPGSNPPETNHFFSVAYSYDLKGRVTHAGGPVNGMSPFNLSYAYDEFDHMTGHSGTYGYNPTSTSDPATYANNRRNGWTYDADGRLTLSPANPASNQRTWDYDAAGRLVTTAETSSAGTSTLTTSYDGDGQVLRQAQVGGPNPMTYYLVRSSVLGGQAVTRLTAAGAKHYTYVPTEGVREVWQEVSSFDGQQIVNSLNLDPQGILAPGGVAYDPLGHEIKVENPQGGQSPSGPQYGPSFFSFPGGFTNAYNFSTGCTLDGMPANCDLLQRSINNGMAARCPDNNCGPQYVTGDDGYSTWSAWRVFTGSGYWLSNGEESMNIFFDDIEYRDPSDPMSWAMFAGGRKKETGKGRGGRRRTRRPQTVYLPAPDPTVYLPAPQPSNACADMARIAQRIMDKEGYSGTVGQKLRSFDREFTTLYAGRPATSLWAAGRQFLNRGAGATIDRYHKGQTGFRAEFREMDRSGNPAAGFHDQTHHFAFYLSMGINESFSQSGALFIGQRIHRVQDNEGDARLGRVAYDIGRGLLSNPQRLHRIGEIISSAVCNQ